MINFWDGVAALSITVLLIIGGYQIYFLPQKYPAKKAASLWTSIDEAIPFRPGWVWVYSFFYYPFIISVIATLNNFRHLAYTALSFIILLVAQLLIAYAFPVSTPPHWREYNPQNSISERFLAFVHRFDQGGNCFPSMHVSVATLSALHISNNIVINNGYWTAIVFCIVALICASTLLTKQHYLADIPSGIALSSGVFWIFKAIY